MTFDEQIAKLAEAYMIHVHGEQTDENYLDRDLTKIKYIVGANAAREILQGDHGSLRAENENYRKAVDALTMGYPSEWAYTILKKERDDQKEKLRVAVEMIEQEVDCEYNGTYRLGNQNIQSFPAHDKENCKKCITLAKIKGGSDEV